jgi:predicted  nucleic acid-binding Zn-ribbon protein
MQDRLREYEMNRTNHIATRKDNINKDLMKDLEAAQESLEELRREKDSLDMDNHKLREQVKYLEDLSNAQKKRNSTGRGNGDDASATALLLTRKENESLRQESRGLKDRIAHLTHELDLASKQQQRPSSSNGSVNQTQIRALESEVNLLRERERELLHQLDVIRGVVTDKEASIAK